MLNRWQAHKGAACGEVAPIIMCLEVAQHCSTSSTPNDSEVSVPRRLRFAPPAVMHGLPSTMAPRCGRWAYCHTPKSLSQKPRKGDWLTQIHWIYKIFLRKSAISARDYLYKEQSLPTHNRASGCNFYNLALTTNVVQSATWG